VAILSSEEDEDAGMFEGRGDSGKYIVVVDPLDGSSNIDVNVGVGTIFSVLAKPADISHDNPDAAVLQPGTQQLAAGYVVYGSSTVLVYTTGHGVHGFTLDPEIGAYVLCHENIRMPRAGRIYSVNEANAGSFSECYQQYLSSLRNGFEGRQYTSRFPSHFTERGRVSVSADARLSSRKVAAVIRSQSDCLHRGTGRRSGFRRPRPDSGNRAP